MEKYQDGKKRDQLSIAQLFLLWKGTFYQLHDILVHCVTGILCQMSLSRFEQRQYCAHCFSTYLRLQCLIRQEMYWVYRLLLMNFAGLLPQVTGPCFRHWRLRLLHNPSTFSIKQTIFSFKYYHLPDLFDFQW
jgi:hypothetical protein